SRGAHAMALHPIQTFARVDPTLFEGIVCTLEGDEQAMDLAAELVRRLGARPAVIGAEDKALYHAALCVACNYLVVLADAGAGLLTTAGLGEDALDALLPLLGGTLDNLRRVGLPDALTGPISRGDVATVRAHLAQLEARRPDLLPLYRILGRRAIDLALRKGSLGEDDADALRRLLGGDPTPSPHGRGRG
ncbi:MAG: DUF2520 domain-containing protein, partial [Planctomycetota bacterium]